MVLECFDIGGEVKFGIVSLLGYFRVLELFFEVVLGMVFLYKIILKLKDGFKELVKRFEGIWEMYK